MASREIQLHQALHGYDDGHRLLRASRGLPPDAERLMLVLSDMSGQSMVRGFETYLTGYPLKEINAYAFARTWYAPEMERPGCVWTHTLIVQNADLARVGDLWSLAEMFIRPERDRASWEAYLRPLQPRAPSLELEHFADRINPEWRSLVENAVVALYGSPSSQVFLPLERASIEHDRLTVALWSQHWARLRRTFKFCTGSIANRRLLDGEFDWQIIPTSSAREIEREVKSAVFISTAGGGVATDSQEWVDAAIGDICDTGSGEIRKVLRVFGVETSRGRADFAPLVQVWIAYSAVRHGSPGLSLLTGAVVCLFPSAQEGKRLKATLYGSEFAPESLVMFTRPAAEAEVLEELATTEHHAAFDGEALRIAGRAAALAGSDFARASRIAFPLLSGEVTPLGEQFIDGFCESITSGKIAELRYDRLDAIYALLRRKPALATLPVLWRSEDYDQRQLFNFASRQLNASRQDVSLIVTAMLEAGSDAAAADAAYDHPVIAVEAALAWCDSRSVDEALNLGIGWRRVLTMHPEICVGWLKRNEAASEATGVLLTLLLNPHSSAVVNGGAGSWVRVARLASPVLQDDALTAAMTFVLALGLHGTDAHSVVLVVEAFEPVYKAAQQDRLSDANWRLLDHQAPPVTWDRGWDRCERLRNALVEHFVKFHWSHEDFLRCLRDPHLLAEVVNHVLRQGKWFNKHRKYVRHVAERTRGGEIEASDEQRGVLAGISAA